MIKISKDGWFQEAKKIPGPREKRYSATNSLLWWTEHSVVGRESEFDDGVPNRFLDMSQSSPGRFTEYAAASCPIVIRESGLLIQMYSLFDCCWTSGGREANTRSTASEAEGGLWPYYDEPLTPFAERTFIQAFWAVHELAGWSKANPMAHLKQHKDVAREFGYAATACASNRYRNAHARIAKGDKAEEDDMSAADKALLIGLATVLVGDESGKDFTTVEEALQVVMDYTKKDRIFALGLNRQSTRISVLEQAMDSLATMGPGSDLKDVIVLRLPDGTEHRVPTLKEVSTTIKK